MANPAADYPGDLHTSVDVSAFAASAMGSTSPTHTDLEGKQESEIVALQQYQYGPVYNVKYHGGAAGDGLTEDTTAIQNTIDACLAAGGGVVYFPPGEYLVDYLTIKDAVSLVGAGTGGVSSGIGEYGATRLVAKSSSASLGLLVMATGRVTGVVIENLALIGDQTSTQWGMYFDAEEGTNNDGGIWQSMFRNIWIKEFAPGGIWFRGGGASGATQDGAIHQFVKMDSVEVYDTMGSAAFKGFAFTGQCGQFVLDQCHTYGYDNTRTTPYGLYIMRECDGSFSYTSDTRPYNLVFTGCTFERTETAVHIDRAFCTNLLGCYFEDSDYGVECVAASENTVVQGCSFNNVYNGVDGFHGSAAGASTLFWVGNYAQGSVDNIVLDNSQAGMVIGDEWLDWTPTIAATGSMTISSPSITSARYRVQGKAVEFSVQATFTTATAQSYGVTLTPPFAYINESVGQAYCGDNGTPYAGIWVTDNDLIEVYKYDVSNWANTSGQSISVTGRFEIDYDQWA